MSSFISSLKPPGASVKDPNVLLNKFLSVSFPLIKERSPYLGSMTIIGGVGTINLLTSNTKVTELSESR